jgi:hypothetical protein
MTVFGSGPSGASRRAALTRTLSCGTGWSSGEGKLVFPLAEFSVTAIGRIGVTAEGSATVALRVISEGMADTSRDAS